METRFYVNISNLLVLSLVTAKTPEESLLTGMSDGKPLKFYYTTFFNLICYGSLDSVTRSIGCSEADGACTICRA